MVFRPADQEDGGLVAEVRVELFTPKLAEGACRAESAKSNCVEVVIAFKSVSVTAAAIAK